MLSTAYLTTAPPPTAPEGTPMNKAQAQKILMIFLVLFLVDMVLLIYTLYCLFSCQFEWYVTLLLLVCVFTPGMGTFVDLGIIWYHHTHCAVRQPMSFEFL